MRPITSAVTRNQANAAPRYIIVIRKGEKALGTESRPDQNPFIWESPAKATRPIYQGIEAIREIRRAENSDGCVVEARNSAGCLHPHLGEANVLVWQVVFAVEFHAVHLKMHLFEKLR